MLLVNRSHRGPWSTRAMDIHPAACYSTATTTDLPCGFCLWIHASFGGMNIIQPRLLEVSDTTLLSFPSRSSVALEPALCLTLFFSALLHKYNSII